MNDAPGNHVPPRLADLPLEARRARQIVVDREIQDGLASRHVVIAADERAFAAANLAVTAAYEALLAAKLRGG